MSTYVLPKHSCKDSSWHTRQPRRRDTLPVPLTLRDTVHDGRSHHSPTRIQHRAKRSPTLSKHAVSGSVSRRVHVALRLRSVETHLRFESWIDLAVWSGNLQHRRTHRRRPGLHVSVLHRDGTDGLGGSRLSAFGGGRISPLLGLLAGVRGGPAVLAMPDGRSHQRHHLRARRSVLRSPRRFLGGVDLGSEPNLLSLAGFLD